MWKKIVLPFALLMLFVIAAVVYEFPPIGKNFNRSVYSVVIHNQTDMVLDSIFILCGSDIKIPETVEKVGEINGLQPKEYRKVNILTSNSPPKAHVPYNVHVVLNEFGIYEVAGYFGIETGGLAVLSISEKDGSILLNRVYEHEHLYKKIDRRNKRNQNELSWYS